MAKIILKKKNRAEGKKAARFYDLYDLFYDLSCSYSSHRLILVEKHTDNGIRLLGNRFTYIHPADFWQRNKSNLIEEIQLFQKMVPEQLGINRENKTNKKKKTWLKLHNFIKTPKMDHTLKYKSKAKNF